MNNQLIKELFAAIDTREPLKFAEYLSDDVSFRFGNSPEIYGINSVIQSLEEFFGFVKQIRHEIIGIWNHGDTWFVETKAHYVDQYGRSFSFPACNIMIFSNDKIHDYRIFVDNSEMFRPPEKNTG